MQDLAGVEIDRHDEPLDGVGEDVVVGGVLEIGQRAGDPAAGVLGIGCAGRPRVDLGVLEPLDAADPERLLPARIGAHHPLGERDDASAGRRMRARHLTCDDHAPGLEVDHELDERVILCALREDLGLAVLGRAFAEGDAREARPLAQDSVRAGGLGGAGDLVRVEGIDRMGRCGQGGTGQDGLRFWACEIDATWAVA